MPPARRAEILISADIFDSGFAAQAIHGADVVVTALGPDFAKRHNPRTTMISPQISANGWPAPSSPP